MAIENHLGEIADDFDAILDAALDKLAFDAQAGYEMQIQANGQVDTRNMLNSCFAVTSRSVRYTPGPDREDLPFSQPHTSYAGISANYAWYQNYGTRYIPARPFFEPVNERMGRVADQVTELIRKRLMRYES